MARILAIGSSAGSHSGKRARAALAQSTSFCTVGAPLTPIAPTTSPFILIGSPPPHAATPRKSGDAGQQRGVALDEVEEVLRGYAEENRSIRYAIAKLQESTVSPAIDQSVAARERG